MAAVIGVLIWLICLILVIYLTHKKNRSMVGMVIFANFLPVIALILILCLKPIPRME